MNRSRTLILPAVLAVTLAACGGGDAASDAPSDEAVSSTAESEEAAPSEDADGAGTSVTLADFAFTTAEVTVAAGDTITFVNNDSGAHTVTEGEDGVAADDARVNERIEAGEEVDVTFDEAGTYQITCLLHPQMHMTVIVEG